MALNPLSNGQDRYKEQPRVIQTSRTYDLDLENGRIGVKIKGEKAIRQAVKKVLITDRFRYDIYSTVYGSMLDDLIGVEVTPELLQAEVEFMLKDAVTKDDRIKDVTNIEINREKDNLFIEFQIQLVEGQTLKEGVTLNV